jgi:hypothetical protein
VESILARRSGNERRATHLEGGFDLVSWPLADFAFRGWAVGVRTEFEAPQGGLGEPSTHRGSRLLLICEYRLHAFFSAMMWRLSLHIYCR